MADDSSEEDVNLLQTFQSAAAIEEKPTMQKVQGVKVSPVTNRSAYEDYPASTTIQKVLDEIHHEDNELEYRVQYDDGTIEIVSHLQLHVRLH